MERPEPDSLMVTQYYWPEPICSAPYCTDLAEWLAVAGWDVRVFTCRPHYPEGVVSARYASGDLDTHDRRGVAIDRVPTGPPYRRRRSAGPPAELPSPSRTSSTVSSLQHRNM